jgi:acyl-CoA synthetase (AMP-forming)/AMP-acid ligase II
MDTLFDLIDARVREAPGAPALLAPDRLPLSYAGLKAHRDAIRRQLGAFGISNGDRIAIVLPNGPEMATAFLAVSSVAACAPLNPGYSVDEFRFYLEDLRARLLITSDPDSPAAAAAAALGIRVTGLQWSPGGEAGVFSFPTGSPALSPAPRGPTPDDVALVLHTSGTTSRPKLVPLTHGNLAAAAVGIGRSLALSAADRCLNIMPLFHVHGLLGALLSSLAAGGSVVCTPGLVPAGFAGWLTSFQPTWYTAVPTLHQSILAALPAGVPAMHRLRFLRSCSSALPPTLMRDLEARFGVPVLEAYGMTEASHQMTCNPLPPRPRKPGSVGIPAGAEVAILDDAGNAVSRGTTGEVCIRGPGVTRGYEANPEANEKAFTHGWFRTGDQGHLDDEGYLFLTGRLKEIINRGGEKISPREIDEVLLQHPAVAQAVAFARPHPTLGEDVAAAVVLRPGATANDQELRAFAFDRLAPFKVPATVVVLSQIPKGPTGKVQRIGLAARLAAELAVPHVAPRDDIEALVADIWREILALTTPGVNDNFFILGGDSVKAGRVMARVNDLFAVDLPVSGLFRNPTIALLAAEVRRQADPEWLDEVACMLDDIRSGDPHKQP